MLLKFWTLLIQKNIKIASLVQTLGGFAELVDLYVGEVASERVCAQPAKQACLTCCQIQILPNFYIREASLYKLEISNK